MKHGRITGPSMRQRRFASCTEDRSRDTYRPTQCSCLLPEQKGRISQCAEGMLRVLLQGVMLLEFVWCMNYKRILSCGSFMHVTRLHVHRATATPLYQPQPLNIRQYASPQGNRPRHSY